MSDEKKGLEVMQKRPGVNHDSGPQGTGSGLS